MTVVVSHGHTTTSFCGRAPVGGTRRGVAMRGGARGEGLERVIQSQGALQSHTSHGDEEHKMADKKETIGAVGIGPGGGQRSGECPGRPMRR